MSSLITVAWIAVIALGVIDAFRHPGADWDYADRDRTFWVVFMVFLGSFFVIPYLLLVRPQFPSHAVKQHTDQFTKR